MTAPPSSAAQPPLDTDTLVFEGLRGDKRLHLDRAALAAGIEAVAAPEGEGHVELLVARGPAGQRQLPTEAELTPAGGMPGDRWAPQEKYGRDYQLATTRSDIARLIANGQPLELHGDNLFLHLDLSEDNLPVGSVLRVGRALLPVTPVRHNGCKKWVQRFGIWPMRLNLDPAYRAQRLRGLYLRVVEPGRVAVGDPVRVLERSAREDSVPPPQGAS